MPPLAEPETLALAMTETLTEALAVMAALPATVAQASALPLWLPMSPATVVASAVSLPAASTSMGPWIFAAWMSAGRFFSTVATTAVTLALAFAAHSSLTVGGVHDAWMLAWPWHEAWHCAFELHLAGVTEPSHFGAVAVPVQPPLQLTDPPQLTPPDAVILQLPLQVPLQVPLQCPGEPGMNVHIASHLPLQVPVHMPVLGIAVPPLAVQVPLQLPAQVPVQSIEPAVGGVHIPVQSASHEPWHMAWTIADPSQYAFALHMPLH